MIHIHKLVIIAALVYVTVSGAIDSSSSDTDKIKKVIKMYNHVVIHESKNRNLPDILTFKNMMKDLTTDRIAEKLYIWIQSWHENNLYMDAYLEKMEFNKINITENSAEVFTDEKWRYKYIDVSIGKVVYPETEVNYKVKYDLIKKDNKWIIKRIKVLSEKQKAVKNKEGKR
ncbi:hypothetical protein [Persephonella sp.]